MIQDQVVFDLHIINAIVCIVMALVICALLWALINAPRR